MIGRVLFRADGNSTIGYGHFIRTLGIASLICDDFECLYATTKPTEYQINEIRKVCEEIIYVEKDESNFLSNLKKGDIVVLDTYDFNPIYQKSIREKGCKLVYIDDHIDKLYVSDAVINNIPGFIESDFKKESYTNLFLGVDYALLRKEFLDINLRTLIKTKNKIFLSFGGADYINLSAKIIYYLKRIAQQIEINVVVGDAYKHIDELKSIGGITVHKNLSAGDMALLMATSEICIISASSLLNEASSIGSKLLIGFFADNQIRPYEFFTQNKLAIGLGDLRNISFENFQTQFDIALETHSMIENQHKIYRLQQSANFKRLFYGLQES